jgi:hypothetical protein
MLGSPAVLVVQVLNVVDDQTLPFCSGLLLPSENHTPFRLTTSSPAFMGGCEVAAFQVFPASTSAVGEEHVRVAPMCRYVVLCCACVWCACA